MNDGTSISDLEDDEDFDNLYEKSINKSVKETIIRKRLPVQRNLFNEVLPGQQALYEEIQKQVTYGPTHHKFKDQNDAGNYDIISADPNESNLSYYIYPTNYQVREYQYNIVKKSLLTNVLCAIPTGMGKTFIASTVMLNFFRWTENAKVIFMAPTRPLVAQQIKACLGITGIPNSETAILLDKTRKNRETIWKEKRVFFTTPQVVENDLKRGVLNPKNIICLVIDEAHRGTGSYAYSNVVKFIDRFNSSYRILALTATPGATLDGVQEVVNNLNISKIELRTEDSPDIVRYMQHKEITKIQTGLTAEIEDIIEQIGIAITPALKQASELGIYEECPPANINAFKAMQQSQKIIANPSIPEGIKWRNFFILQLLNHVGQMLKRIKIYGIRTFYNYFTNKFKEFTTKYTMGKSTNKIAADFYFNSILKLMMTQCDKLLADKTFLGHEKLQYIRDELEGYFKEGINQQESRVIIFTELRESALEIVKCIDGMDDEHIRPHIFIGQAKGKEGFDDVGFRQKHKPKGRKKVDRLKRQEEDVQLELQKQKDKEQAKLERSSRRTASSEEAQIKGMTQKQQKEVIQNFKKGEYNVLVCTSIGEEGLDIGEVDLIICYDTTSSPIKNIQRMGRTGRKRDGQVILLFSSNESYKFQQAMDDYANLQKLISQDHIDYQHSDRIIPKTIIPRCEEVFIKVSAEDQELNNIEDSDEVIRYATQCMLGKNPKVKKKADKTTKKKGKKTVEDDNSSRGPSIVDRLKRKAPPTKTASKKTFFMPDNVETGIVKASDLVNKFVTDPNGDKRLVEKEPSLETVKPLKKRKFTTLDKFENDSMSSDDEALGNYASKHSPIKVKSEKSNVNIKYMEDIKPPKLTVSVKKEKSECLDEIAGTYNEQVVKKEATKEKLINNSSDIDYFKKNYNPKAIPSITVNPRLDKNSKVGRVPHSRRVQSLLHLFEKVNNRDKATIIEMNRIKCMARRLAHINSSNEPSQSNINTSLISQESNIDDSIQQAVTPKKEKTKKQDLSNDDVLDELLGSDSDLEL